MVRKKADSQRKTLPFAPMGKLLTIARNKSMLTPDKTPNSIKSKGTPVTPLSSGHKNSVIDSTVIKSSTKKRRLNPGTRAIREIKKFQSTTGLLIPKASFSRVVKEIMQTTFEKPDFRFSTMAMIALQEATEMAIVNLLEVANLCCIHAKRITLHPSDIRLTRQAFGLGHPVNDR